MLFFLLLFFFSNQPFIGIDSDIFFYFIFFILELFKEAWECGYNTNNDIEKTVTITSGFSILVRQHDAFIDNFDVRFMKICLLFSDCF